MHWSRNSLLLLLLALAFSASCFAQSSKEQNQRSLKKYFQSRVVTELDWELMYFNIHWQGAYTGSVDYLTSTPVSWDVNSARFRAGFRVQDRRDYRDTRPFFSMSKPEREAILRGAIESLTALLSQFFPEVSGNPGLVYVEFKFAASTGGFSNVAVYENGRLVFSE